MLGTLKNFKCFPIFLGTVSTNNQINFFNSFIFESGNVFRFSKVFYKFWNAVAWFNFLKLTECGGIVAAFCSNFFLLKLKTFTSSTRAFILPSNFFVSCGGFLSNFVIFRWYAFFSKIRVPKKMPNVAMFLDGLISEHHLVECSSTRTVSVGFFNFSRRVYALSHILFFQPWVSGSSKFLTANFYLFVSFLKPLLGGQKKY